MNKITKIFGVLALIFLIFSSNSTQAQLQEGTKAPAFTLKNLDGKSVKLSDFKGKVLIIDFWATWCPPCKAEIPDFIDLYKTYQKKGLVILGIALDDKEKVSKFAKDYNINYPIVIGDQSISALYGGITGIPTTFIIDRKGVIKAVHVGYKTKDVFEKEIKALL